MRLKFYTSIMMLALGLGQAWADVPTIAGVDAMNKYVSSLKLPNLAANSQLQYVNFDAETNNYSLPANVVAKNSKGEWYADEIVLADKKDYTADEDVYAKNITYTRNFSSKVTNNWQALYVPFGFNPADYLDDFDVAEIFTICPVTDTDNNGVIDSGDTPYMIVTFVKDGITKPNVPYVIRPKKVGDCTIVAKNSMLKAACQGTLEFGSTRVAYKITGLSEKKMLNPGDGNYYMDVKGLFNQVAQATNLTANRWYYNKHIRDYGVSSYLFNPTLDTRAVDLRIMVLGEDIEEAPVVVESNEDGKENSIFTINGMKIQSLDGAPAGVYIVNGKKVIKK